jgi:hypothetical protein
MSGEETGGEDATRVSDDLTRRYRLLLLAYPLEYRERRGDELLGTVLDDAPPGQRWPSGRQAGSIAVQGLRARLDAARCRTPGAVWSEGLQMGALLLLGFASAELVSTLVEDRVSVLEVVAAALAPFTTVAAVWGRRIAALALATAWLALVLPGHLLSWPLATAVVALGASAVRFRSPRQVRSAWWLLVAPVLLAIEFGPSLLVGGTDYVDPVTWLASLAAVAGLVLACVIGLALDPRIPIAVACLAVALLLRNTVGFLPFGGSPDSGVWFVFHPLTASYVLLAVVAVLFLAGYVRSHQLARP